MFLIVFRMMIVDGMFFFLFRTQWIYDASDIIYPSVYMSEELRPNDRVRMVRGRMKESLRLAKQSRNPQKPQVYAYHRYIFRDTKNLLGDVSKTYSRKPHRWLDL